MNVDIAFANPAAYLLHGRAREIYFEKNWPHVPLTEKAFKEAFAGAGREEVKAIANRAAVIRDIATMIINAAEVG
jgi:hypothetical protein